MLSRLSNRTSDIVSGRPLLNVEERACSWRRRFGVNTLIIRRIGKLSSGAVLSYATVDRRPAVQYMMLIIQDTLQPSRRSLLQIPHPEDAGPVYCIWRADHWRLPSISYIALGGTVSLLTRHCTSFLMIILVLLSLETETASAPFPPSIVSWLILVR